MLGVSGWLYNKQLTPIEEGGAVCKYLVVDNMALVTIWTTQQLGTTQLAAADELDYFDGRPKDIQKVF